MAVPDHFLLVHDFLLDLLKFVLVVAVKHLSSCDENIFNILTWPSRCFKVKVNFLFSLKRARLLWADLALRFQVLLRANQEHQHLFVSSLAEHFFLPLRHVVKRIRIGEVEAEENAVSAAVENFGDGLETFLPRCVPNLHLENFLVNFEKDRAELNANRDLMVVLELVRGHFVH